MRVATDIHPVKPVIVFVGGPWDQEVRHIPRPRPPLIRIYEGRYTLVEWPDKPEWYQYTDGVENGAMGRA